VRKKAGPVKDEIVNYLELEIPGEERKVVLSIKGRTGGGLGEAAPPEETPPSGKKAGGVEKRGIRLLGATPIRKARGKKKWESGDEFKKESTPLPD